MFSLLSSCMHADFSDSAKNYYCAFFFTAVHTIEVSLTLATILSVNLVAAMDMSHVAQVAAVVSDQHTIIAISTLL